MTTIHHNKIICEECGNEVNQLHSARKFGHWFCGRCKRRVSYPKLFAKLFPQIFGDSTADKHFNRTIKGLQLTSDEKDILYKKHWKEGMPKSEIKEKLKTIRERIKHSHEIEKIRIAAEKAQQRNKGIIMPYEVGK